MTDVQNIDPIAVTHKALLGKAYTRQLLLESLKVGTIQVDDGNYYYGKDFLGQNLFKLTISDDLKKRLLGEIARKKGVTEKALTGKLESAAKKDLEDRDFVYQNGKVKSLVRRTPEELRKLLEVRVGPVANYEPIKAREPLYAQVPWRSVELVIETSLDLVYRIIYTQLLLDRRPHMILDGTQLLASYLGQDNRISTDMMLSSFASYPQLFFVFGYSELNNKLYPELVKNLLVRRLQFDRQTWLFCPSVSHITRSFALDEKYLGNLTKVTVG